MADFETDLTMRIIKSVQGLHVNSTCVRITMDDGVIYEMLHRQDCCESVSLEEFDCTVEDWDGALVVKAYASSERQEDKDSGTTTYTFYSLWTSRGYLHLRWCGSSNGYYSESVDFEEATINTESDTLDGILEDDS